MASHGRYTILGKLADGGMAEIFLAVQHGAEGFEKRIVLKRILTQYSADPQFRNMLLDEAHISMSLQHSNIAQVQDLGVAGGRYFMALELVDGWDLERIMQRAYANGMVWPAALSLHVIACVCRALAYAHAKSRDGKPLGIVHRDISPNNVLISDQGEVKLTDFGIAKAQRKREQTAAGVIKGKVAYMSPEQALGATIDKRSDIFSVGSMLYRMVTDKLPFEAADDMEQLVRVQKAQFTPPEQVKPTVSPSVSGIIMRALRLQPGERYQTADEMLADVERVLRNEFHSAGQTELKLWLEQLGRRDDAPTISKRRLDTSGIVKDADGDGPVGGDVVRARRSGQAGIAAPTEYAMPSRPDVAVSKPPPLPQAAGRLDGADRGVARAGAAPVGFLAGRHLRARRGGRAFVTRSTGSSRRTWPASWGWARTRRTRRRSRRADGAAAASGGVTGEVAQPKPPTAPGRQARREIARPAPDATAARRPGGRRRGAPDARAETAAPGAARTRTSRRSWPRRPRRRRHRRGGAAARRGARRRVRGHRRGRGRGGAAAQGGGREAGGGRKREAAPPPGKPAAKAETAILHITSAPAGAVVRTKARVLGRTPIKLHFKTGNTYEISAAQEGLPARDPARGGGQREGAQGGGDAEEAPAAQARQQVVLQAAPVMMRAFALAIALLAAPLRATVTAGRAVAAVARAGA